MGTQGLFSNDGNIDASKFMEVKHSAWIIYLLCLLSICWAYAQYIMIERRNVDPFKIKSLPCGVPDEESEKNQLVMGAPKVPQNPQACYKQMVQIQERIQAGAQTFLRQEYSYLGIFCVLFAIVIFLTAEVNDYPYTTCAFLLGASTSMICGYLGMMIAVKTNWKTTAACCESIDEGFHVAYQGGQVLGFSLVGIALFILMALLQTYAALLLPPTYKDKDEVIEKHI
jgi:hypothetical protein